MAQIPVTGLAYALAKRQEDDKPIRVCVISAGEMGTDLVVAIRQMQGMEISAIVDRRLASAPQAIEIAGYPADKGQICESRDAVSKA